MTLDELLSEAILVYEKASYELEKAKLDVLSLEEAKAGAKVVLAELVELIETIK